MNKVSVITKRNGDIVPYNRDKIFNAISKANDASRETMNSSDIENVTQNVENELIQLNRSTHIGVEAIQDIVEEQLMRAGFYEIAKKYIMYRSRHTMRRESSKNLMNLYNDIMFTDSADRDFKRENANINTDTPMGIMLKIGTEGTKYFIDNYILPDEIHAAESHGWIHIHDKDFSMITFNCCQIDLLKVLHGGFNNGHGYIREPGSIRSYSALGCIVIQSNQNSMFGGQSIGAYDFAMAEGIRKSFIKILINKIYEYLLFTSFSMPNILKDYNIFKDTIIELINQHQYSIKYTEKNNPEQNIYRNEYINNLYKFIEGFILKYDININSSLSYISAKKVYELSCHDVEEETHQAMEAAIHNFCSLHSRAGSQIPFSSINFGTDITPEGRLAIKEILNAIEAGLGNGETAIFPISIFKLRKGVNFEEGDPNYDLFLQACKVSAKRLFPNFLNVSSSFNAPYLGEIGEYNKEVTAMGCRTRVMGNVNGPEESGSRGNFSFTTINLPKIALEARKVSEETGNIIMNIFWELFDKYIKICHDYLLFRLQIIADKHVYNFPFLMGQGVWMDSEKLKPTDTIRDVLKHASFSIGLCGLAECLIALIGKHHGESEEAQELGLEIARHLRKKCDEYAKKEHMNWTCFATPAESTAGTFQRMNRKQYGIIKGVTDRDYMTNSHHCPVYYQITAAEKIRIEAPYHQIFNAGTISYVEMDGDPSKNVPAFVQLVKAMRDADMGYFSINHPVDRDPVCGYTGIIQNECPHCKRREDGHYHDRMKAL